LLIFQSIEGKSTSEVDRILIVMSEKTSLDAKEFQKMLEENAQEEATAENAQTTQQKADIDTTRQLQDKTALVITSQKLNNQKKVVLRKSLN